MNRTINYARVRFPALGENESFARIVTAGFVMKLGVTPSVLADLKTIVSEAVTNAVVHAYRGRDGKDCPITLELKFDQKSVLTIAVKDEGCGIPDVEAAMQPFFTTDREGERSGMGLPIIQAFSDSMKLKTSPKGTKIIVRKHLG